MKWLRNWRYTQPKTPAGIALDLWRETKGYTRTEFATMLDTTIYQLLHMYAGKRRYIFGLEAKMRTIGIPEDVIQMVTDERTAWMGESENNG